MDQLQKLMSDIYKIKDARRGLDKTFLWLVSEIGEVSDLIVKNKDVKNNKKVMQELKLEIADCQAWLYSVANLLEIDVEKAVLEKYPNVCPRCIGNPCKCTEQV